MGYTVDEYAPFVGIERTGVCSTTANPHYEGYQWMIDATPAAQVVETYMCSVFLKTHLEYLLYMCRIQHGGNQASRPIVR